MTPVGRAVPVVAAEPEHDPAAGQGQPGPLQHPRRVGAGRVHVPLHPDHAGPGGQPDQHVRGFPVGHFVGDHEDLAASRVDDRGPGDAHGRRDVTARQRAGRDRGGQVPGPVHRAGGRGQRVDGVPLRGHVHPAAGHQRLAVDLPVQPWRGPRRGRGVHVGRGARHPGAGGVPVVDGPGPPVRAARRGGRPGGRRGGRGGRPGQAQAQAAGDRGRGQQAGAPGQAACAAAHAARVAGVPG